MNAEKDYKFYLIPLANQVIGAIFYVFLIFQFTDIEIANIGSIISLIGMISPLVLLRLDIFITHSKGLGHQEVVVFYSSVLSTFLIGMTLGLMFFWVFVDYFVVANVESVIIILCIVIQIQGLLVNGILVNKQKLLTITRLRLYNFLASIFFIPIIIYCENLYLAAIFLACKNNFSFCLYYMIKLKIFYWYHNEKTSLNESVIKLIKLRKKWLPLLADFTLNQGFVHAQILLLAFLQPTLGSAVFIVNALATNMNAVYSKTFGLKLIVDAQKETSKIVLNFIKQTAIRSLFILSVAWFALFVIIRIANNIELENYFYAFTVCLPFIYMQLIVSSSTQYYLILNKANVLLKYNFIAGLVRLTLYAICLYAMNDMLYSFAISNFVYYVMHLRLLYRNIDVHN